MVKLRTGSEYFDLDCFTYLYGRASLEVVHFDKTGALYLGGTSYRQVGFQLAQFGSYYHQPAISSNLDGYVPVACVAEPIIDCLLLCFDPQYQLRFATYIGGPAFWQRSERLHDVLLRNVNDNLYLVGNTTKFQNLTSYFPLDDGGGIPSFWPDWAGGESDAFISTFCTEEMPVAVTSAVLDDERLYWYYVDPDRLAIMVYLMARRPCRSWMPLAVWYQCSDQPLARNAQHQSRSVALPLAYTC